MANKIAAIIDYGVGNIRSVKRAIESTQVNNGSINVVVTHDINEIKNSDLIVLPGVGSYGPSSYFLKTIKDDLVQIISSGKPTLGMCLGMQLLFDQSEEDKGDGLGVFAGRVTKLKSNIVPNMGWNQVEIIENSLYSLKWAYFAHSFACRPVDENIVIGWTKYGEDKFPSIVNKENIFATQFHPEKSDVAGIKLIHQFISKVLS